MLIVSPQQQFKVVPDIDKHPCEEYGLGREPLLSGQSGGGWGVGGVAAKPDQLKFKS